MPPASDSTAPVPIVGGTGALGYGLALRWAKAGLAVTIGSRSSGRAEEAAARLRETVPEAQVDGLVNEEAAGRGPVVFLTVPFRAQSENLNNLRPALQEGQLLVDCTVPLAAAMSGKREVRAGPFVRTFGITSTRSLFNRASTRSMPREAGPRTWTPKRSNPTSSTP